MTDKHKGGMGFVLDNAYQGFDVIAVEDDYVLQGGTNIRLMNLADGKSLQTASKVQ